MKRHDWILLGVIIILAVLLRSYKLTSPLSDAYSWRQSDTAAVARNFTRTGFDLLHPQYDDLSAIQSGIENPKGLRFVEMPLYNALFALFYKIAPFIPIEVWGRIVSIQFSLIIIAILYYLALKEANRVTAVATGLIYAVFPSFVFFSRVVLPETPALAFTFLSILLLYRSLHIKKNATSPLLYLLASVCFGIGILIKPTVIFYGVVLCYLFIRAYEFEVVKKIQPYLFFVIAFIPFVLWRLYIQQYPEGIPANDWLFTQVNTFEGQKNIFLKPAFFRWIFFERINTMIFGGYLTVFFITGIFSKRKALFLHSILFSAFSYLFVFQGGNVQHEYYQTLILPALALFAGAGIATFLSHRNVFLHPLALTFGIGVLCVGSFFFSYYYKVKDFYTYPKDLNLMAKIIQTFTKPGDKIVADRMGDTTLLYLSDRKGLPLLSHSLEELRNKGFSYVLTDQKESIKRLKTDSTVHTLFENDQFALLKL